MIDIMTLKVAERKDSQIPLIHSREHSDENGKGELEFLFLLKMYVPG